MRQMRVLVAAGLADAMPAVVDYAVDVGHQATPRAKWNRAEAFVATDRWLGARRRAGVAIVDVGLRVPRAAVAKVLGTLPDPVILVCCRRPLSMSLRDHVAHNQIVVEVVPGRRPATVVVTWDDDGTPAVEVE